MSFIRKTADENRWFLLPYLLWLLVGLVLVAAFPKAELHLMLNAVNSRWADWFFVPVTYLGDGIVIALVAVALLFVRFAWAIALACAGFITLVFVQGFKRLIFSDVMRPVKYFAKHFPDINLHIPEGTQPAAMHSFPSGHSTAAFTVFFFLAILCNKKYMKLILFFLAAVAAYSRVYLSWHFTEDILAGSVLGIFIAGTGFYISKQLRRNWAQKSLLSIFRNSHETHHS